MDDITYQIAMLVISIFGLLLSYFGVPFLKTKFNAEQLKIIETWIRVAVVAAEQIFQGTKQGPSKKIYVIEFLAEKGIKLTEQELDVLIESSVYELNKVKDVFFEDEI